MARHVYAQVDFLSEMLVADVTSVREDPVVYRLLVAMAVASLAKSATTVSTLESLVGWRFPGKSHRLQ